MTSPDLKPFVEKAFEILGAVVEPSGPESLEVLLPELWTAHFEGSDFLHLEFPREEKHGDQSPRDGRPPSLMSVGSPLLERLLEAISTKGLLSKAYLNPLHLELHNPEEKFSRQIRVVNARPTWVSAQNEEVAHGIFQFKVTYLTDDKQERLHRVAVNLATGLENKGLVREWDRLFLDPEPAYEGIARFELPDLRPAYERAWGALRADIEEDAAKVRALQDKFLGRDLARIEDYYGGLLAELDEKEKRLGEGSDDLLKEKSRQRRMTITLDRQKKALDARDKYRLEVAGAPVNLLILYQPWIRVNFRFRTRAGEIERPFYWDPALKEFAATACEECRRIATTFVVDNQTLLCSDCR